VHPVCGILGIASIKVASWYIHTEPIPPLGTIYRVSPTIKHLDSSS
jgi:hypothetical protein